MECSLNIQLPMNVFANFKQKQVVNIMGIINGGRIRESISFDSYANLYFDETDTLRMHPKVKRLDDFNRVKTNCLIYNIIPNDINKGYYEKIYIYIAHNTTDPVWGYVAVNEKEGREYNNVIIEGGYDKLVREIHRILELGRRRDMYEKYSERYNMLKNMVKNKK